MLMVGPQARVDAFKSSLAQSFEITGGDPIKTYLGMEFTRTDAGFTVTQDYIIEKLLVRAGKDISNQKTAQVPMRNVCLNKDTSPTTPEEKARWKEMPYRSYLGAIGYAHAHCVTHFAITCLPSHTGMSCSAPHHTLHTLMVSFRGLTTRMENSTGTPS